jgi:hypothetical protein
MIGQTVRLPGFVGAFYCRLARQKSLRRANVHSSVEVVGDTKRIKSLDRCPLLIKPQLDWKFLSDSSKLTNIRNNIKRRNESGDIDVLVRGMLFIGLNVICNLMWYKAIPNHTSMFIPV